MRRVEGADAQGARAPGVRKRVGLVGCGTIGSRIARRIRADGLAEIAFVCELDEGRARAAAPDAEFLPGLDEAARRPVDLVIEAANADVTRAIALGVLEHADFLPFTLTGLADDAFREAVRDRCRQAGTRLFIPHGAVLGLDGMHDGREVIREVVFTTTKNPRNLGLEDGRAGVVYDGPTRGACARFPRNVNVHAAFALMGIGFDRQRSVVIADPATGRMRHQIEVRGDALAWSLDIASIPAGTVTSSYTLDSAASTVARILGGRHDIVLA